jgi:hypothetical protein
MGKLRADGPGVNLVMQTASRAAAWRLLPNVVIMSCSGRDTGLSAEKHDFRDSHSIGRQLAMVVRWSAAHCAAHGGQRDPGLPVPVPAYGNPSFRTVHAVLREAGLEISVRPRA